MSSCHLIADTQTRKRKAVCRVIGSVFFFALSAPAFPQQVDCTRLAAQISTATEKKPKASGPYAAGLAKLREELDRTIQYARSLRCDQPRFPLFNDGSAACVSLNARIQQLQSTIAQYQNANDASGSDAVRQQLIASYNAHCRGGGQTAERPPGFLEQLFGALLPNTNPASPPPQQQEIPPVVGEEPTKPHGGSQAVCVRSCDGGFFPLSLSPRDSDPGQLASLCQVLCPNAEVSVYTRSPNREISSAVSLEGETPYSEMPNALKFEKHFDPACTCKPPGKSWAEALAGAEEVLGRARKGDVLVTPETSVELAKPSSETGIRPKSVHESGADGLGADKEEATQDITGPDGVRRRVRIIVPPL
ncbi:MAG TPA: DUF2865 domain-containing protein [Methylocella sp.]|nr:DUF2865 domain-containing protein [Methylocella sp.]